jgi:hypothetical protein
LPCRIGRGSPGISRMLPAHADKPYIESHRCAFAMEGATLTAAQAFFAGRGIETAGGITCHDLPSPAACRPSATQTRKARALSDARGRADRTVEDFFYTRGKSDAAITARGAHSGTEHRLPAGVLETVRDTVAGVRPGDDVGVRP